MFLVYFCFAPNSLQSAYLASNLERKFVVWDDGCRCKSATVMLLVLPLLMLLLSHLDLNLNT